MILVKIVTPRTRTEASFSSIVPKRRGNTPADGGGTVLRTVREIAAQMKCAQRTARRTMRREFGVGVRAFGAEKWPQAMVEVAILRDVLRREGKGPGDDGWI
jgi:hypothetical protein